MNTNLEIFMEKIIIGTIIIMVGLGVVSFGFDFYYLASVWTSKTQEELKHHCTIDWYKNSQLDRLPAQCRQFYSQGINLTK